MTYEQLISNKEQMEAHWRDFLKEWNDTIEPALLEEHPDMPPVDVRNYRDGAWRSYVIDALIIANELD